jgi:Rod binding domain-containing protein
MSVAAATGLPPIDTTFEPAGVRNGSAASKRAYNDALQFESMLVQQLSQSLAASSGLSGAGGESEGESESEGGGESSAASSQLASLLPQTLTESVMSHGGLGLAKQMMGSIERDTTAAPAVAAPASATPAGGVPAPAGSVPAAALSTSGGVAA